MSNCGKSYEECLIHDDNWYTYYEMGDLYPMDEVYCLTKVDPNTRATLYQPKVLTTCNLDVYMKAIEEFSITRHTSQYSTSHFIGPVILSLQTRIVL